MIVVTVARKPLASGTVAANVLEHGAGALNIDATRLKYPSGKPESGWSKTGSDGRKGYQDSDTFKIRAHSAEEIQARVAGGRWPANLILEHRPGCRKVGEREVEGDGHWPAARGRGSETAGPSGHAGQSGLEEKFATETVAVWECESGCPLADLDGQSGVVPTGSWVRQTDGAHPFGNAVGSPYQQWKDVSEAPGGASRFFKQVGGRKG